MYILGHTERRQRLSDGSLVLWIHGIRFLWLNFNRCFLLELFKLELLDGIIFDLSLLLVDKVLQLDSSLGPEPLFIEIFHEIANYLQGTDAAFDHVDRSYDLIVFAQVSDEFEEFAVKGLVFAV